MSGSSAPELSWLADSPVFIDSQQVSAFYDAVVGPAFRTVQLQVSAGRNELLEKSAGGSVSAGLPALFPWLKFDVGADAKRSKTRGRQEGQSIVLQPVENAARQLVQLCLHYLVNQQNRICLISTGSEIPSGEDISASPRMLVFIDVPPGTIFMPQAAELDNGRVVTFFDPLIEKLRQNGGTPPAAYPDSTVTEQGKRQRDAHWKWYADHWNLDKAVKATEETIGDGGRPRWIDYRMTVSIHGGCDLGAALP